MSCNTDPVSNTLLYDRKTNPRTSGIFKAFKNALTTDPELQKLGITDDDYDTVTYNFINQAFTPGTKLYNDALNHGVNVDKSNVDIAPSWEKVYKPETFSRLEEMGMNPKAALLLLGTQRAQNKK